MNDRNQTLEWAPDGCPPAVVRMIDEEQYIEDMMLRGLGSANSTEFCQAVRNLKAHLGAAFEAGQATRPKRPLMSYAIGYVVIGFVAGALCGAWLGVYLTA